MKRRWIAAVLFCALCLFAVSRVCWLWKIYPLVSVRSGTWNAEQQQAMIHAASKIAGPDDLIRISFWRETQARVRTTWHTGTALVLTFCGTADSAYPARLVTGRFPANGEKHTCAVSSALAWTLWGSTDILGQTVAADKTQYTVAGIFQSGAALMLCGGAPDGSYENIEFAGRFSTPPTELAESVLRAAGIADSAELFFPFPWMAALTGYALFPLGMRLLFLLRRLFRKVPRTQRAFAAPVCVFAAAFLLPALLAVLPPWATPARWSDFSYWRAWPQTLHTALNQFFSISPSAKDILAKNCVLQVLLGTSAAAFLACGLHPGQEEVRQVLETAERKLYYLPAYSPDLNPIEEMWSKMKAVLRKPDDPPRRCS